MATEINLITNKGNSFPYSEIQLPAKKNIIIPVDTDSFTIRELGNIIYSEVLGKYVTCWSQGPNPYVQDDIFIHLAVSDSIDKDWVIIGKVTPTPSEDPFILEENGTLYILTEKKVSTGQYHDDIELWKLTDIGDLLNGWTSLGYALQKDPTKDWQNQEVSSPTYYRQDGISYLYFEGRGTVSSVFNLGAIGLATSTGIEDVFTHTNLVIAGSSLPSVESDSSWASSFVPDDIVKINNTYFIICHSYSELFGWRNNIVQSESLTEGWREYVRDGIPVVNNEDNVGGTLTAYYKGYTTSPNKGGIALGQWGVSTFNQESESESEILGVRNYLNDSNFIEGMEEAVNWRRIPLDSTITLNNGIVTYTVGNTTASSRLEKVITLNSGVYTLSLKVRTSANLEFFAFVGATILSTETMTSSTEFTVVKCTFRVTSSPNTLRIYYRDSISNGDTIEVEYFKLEEGYEATGWIQSPFDGISNWDTVNTAFPSYIKNKPIGVSGTFEDANGQIVTVDRGIITSII